MTENLLLDPAIRDWVVLPMVAMMVMVGLGRHYVQQLMKSDADLTEEKIEEMRLKQTLGRAVKLRTSGVFINEESFQSRKGYFIRKKENEEKKPAGVLREKNLPTPQNPMMGNPMAMVDMMEPRCRCNCSRL